MKFLIANLLLVVLTAIFTPMLATNENETLRKFGPWVMVGLTILSSAALFVDEIKSRSADKLAAEEAHKAAYLGSETFLPRAYTDEPILFGGPNPEMPHLVRGEAGVNDIKLFIGAGVHFHIDDDRNILVNAEVRDEKGAILARILNSRPKFLPGGVRELDFNSNMAAMEVVDADTLPIIQVFREASGWRVYFAIYGETGQAYMCTTNRIGPTDPSNVAPGRRELKRLFRYPGIDHPGVLDVL